MRATAPADVRAMKTDAGKRWNPANLEVALQFQRMLERDVWNVDDVNRLSNEFVTGDFHDGYGHWCLRRAVEQFVNLVHQAASNGNAGEVRPKQREAIISHGSR
jgi:hypothetical protein